MRNKWTITQHGNLYEVANDKRGGEIFADHDPATAIRGWLNEGEPGCAKMMQPIGRLPIGFRVLHQDDDVQVRPFIGRMIGTGAGANDKGRTPG